MDKDKKARLEAQGWRVGSAEELLGLTPEETAYVELRLKLGDAVREFRKKKQMTQVQLAELLQSSQSRVAKVEAADESVSLDLLIRSLLAMGATHQDLARVITSRTASSKSN
jgi:predicted XRE-type DNA-binding protein